MSSDGEARNEETSDKQITQREVEKTRLEAIVDEQNPEIWAESIVIGGFAYVLGFIITSLFFFIGPAQTFGGLSLLKQLSNIGIVFNAAHGVATVASKPLVVINQSGAVNLGQQFDFFRLATLVGGQQAIPRPIYMAVPIVVLLVVASSRAWLVSRSESRWGTVLPMLGIGLGYTAVAFLGTLVFSIVIDVQVQVESGIAVLATVPFTSEEAVEEGIVIFTANEAGALATGFLYATLCAVTVGVLVSAIRERY